MKFFYASFLAIACSFIPTSSFGQDAGILPGDILLMLTPEGSPQAIADDLRVLDGISTGIYIDHEVSAPMRIWLLKFDHTAIAQQRMLKAIEEHPQVIMAQNDHPVTFRNVPNDPQYGDQWHHDNIDSEIAWAISTGGVTALGDSIVVCIIEGSNLLHPDLIGNRWINHAEIPNNGIDDDNNGYVDDHLGWNPGANNDDVYNGGHGTNVAGMIGAKGDNGLGMAGANWDVKMMVVTVGSLSQTNVIASYTYPIQMRRRYNASNGNEGAFVVATNASWGIDNGNPANYPLWCALYDTLGTAGILNCGATANNNVNIDNVGDLPTACPSDFMVSVTATNNNDMRTFSGYGATTIDVGAPGSDVFTTSGSNGYTSTSGTSFASPLTAGVIGLLYSAPCPSLMTIVRDDPMAGALLIRQMLFDGVDIGGNLPGNTVTGGRINAGTSMELIMASCGACPAPYAPAVQATGSNEVLFSWNSFSGGPYTIRYRPAGSDDWLQIEGLDDPFHTITLSDPCMTHEFQVGVECDGGEMEFSATALYEPENNGEPDIIIADGVTTVCEGESVMLTSSSSFGNLWSNGSTEQSIIVSSTGTYAVTVTSQCDTTTSVPVEIQVLAPEPPITDEFVLLPGVGSVILTADGDSILWYDAPVGGSIVGTGDWETPVLDQATSFWSANILTNDLTPTFGGPEQTSAAGQYHNNATYFQLFTANGPFVILSVKVFADGAGTRPIGLVDMATGTVVAQGNFMIPNGESRVNIDLVVPAAGQYGLRVMNGDPQLWRDGIGSGHDYPYSLGEYGAITSSSVDGANATVYYYFFYDWEVGPIPIICESERVEVMIDLMTGIDDAGSVLGMQVYPNPANDHVIIEVVDAPARSVVNITDGTGRQIALHNMQSGFSVIDTRALANGPYIFSIIDSDARIAQGRFVIAR